MFRNRLKATWRGMGWPSRLSFLLLFIPVAALVLLKDSIGNAADLIDDIAWVIIHDEF